MEKKYPLLFSNPQECFGCSACASICPRSAIKMERDNEGFLYPVVQENLCVSCKMCLQVCPKRNGSPTGTPLRILGAKAKELPLRMRSSSGGAFSWLARWTQMRGGVICGVAFDEDFLAVHRCAEEEKDWSVFCTSKYMQSTLGNSFRQIRRYLDDGRAVLFTGTPCQVAGLQRYLANCGTDAQRLVTCDIVCHGTPSPMVWRDYLDYLCKITHHRIGSVNFRNKQNVGWHGSTLVIHDTDGNTLLEGNQGDNCYFQLFFRHLILRPSCHICPYASLSRPGDVTIGDFWGVEKSFPEFDDDKGISLLFCNTEKGLDVWRQISEHFDTLELSAEQCLQPNLHTPAQKPGWRQGFWEGYRDVGFARMAKNMGLLPLTPWERLRKTIGSVRGKLSKMIKGMIEK